MRPDNNWHLDPWRAPTLAEGDELLFDEPGRILDNIDYRSHWFRVIKPRYAFYTLLVKHGGGEERREIGHGKRIVATLALLDTDSRYHLLHTLHNIARENHVIGVAEATARYREAFRSGRLMKRKMPGRDVHKIWIEPAAS